MSTAHGPALPGFGSAAVGFDAPFDMLEACHERVLRTLGLQARLIEHLTIHGCDESARSAARDVLRYFELAAPLHHEDEELHVFPALQGHGNPELAAAVARLMADHDAMARRWTTARRVLQEIESGAVDRQGQAAPLSAGKRALLEAFAEGYESHIRLEEDFVYPAAKACLSTNALQAMGTEMRLRRVATR